MYSGWRYLFASIKVPIIISIIIGIIALIPLKIQINNVQKSIGSTPDDSYYIWDIDGEKYNIPKYVLTVDYPEKITIASMDNRTISFTIAVSYKIIPEKIPSLIKNFHLGNNYDELTTMIYKIIVSQMQMVALKYEYRSKAFTTGLDTIIGRWVDTSDCLECPTEDMGVEIVKIVYTTQPIVSEPE